MTAARSRGVVSASVIYLGSNALNAAIPFALLPILTRYLDPTQYGEVAMVQTVLVALASVVGLSLQAAAGRKYFDLKDSPGELRHFIGACLLLLAATTATALLVVLLAGGPVAEWLGIRAAWLPWAVLASGAGFVILIRMSQWQVREQPFRYGGLQVSQSALNMGVSLVLVVWLARGAQGRIEAVVGVPIALAAVSLVLLARDGLLGFAWRPQYIKEAASFGLPLLPHAVGLFLLSTADRVVVKQELGIAQAGVYMVAVQLAMGLALVFDSVNSSYVPWLFARLQRNDDAEKRQTVRWTYWYFLAALGTAAIAFLIGPMAVEIIAGPAYADAGRVIGWLALGQAFAGMYLMVTNYIFYSKRTGMLSVATIVSGVLTLGLLIVLTRLYGLTGAAIAFALGSFFRFLITWWVAQRRHPMPWFHAFPSQLTPENVNAQ